MLTSPKTNAYTGNMELELKVIENPTYSDSYKRFSVWLMLEGKAVAWAVVSDSSEHGQYLCLCDIETRPGYQRQGYAKKLIALITDEMGKPLALTGALTPEGWNAFHGKLPLLPKYEEPTAPNFRSMTFVEDWDRMYAPS